MKRGSKAPWQRPSGLGTDRRRFLTRNCFSSCAHKDRGRSARWRRHRPPRFSRTKDRLHRRNPERSASECGEPLSKPHLRGGARLLRCGLFADANAIRSMNRQWYHCARVKTRRSAARTISEPLIVSHGRREWSTRETSGPYEIAVAETGFFRLEERRIT